MIAVREIALEPLEKSGQTHQQGKVGDFVKSFKHVRVARAYTAVKTTVPVMGDREKASYVELPGRKLKIISHYPQDSGGAFCGQDIRVA